MQKLGHKFIKFGQFILAQIAARFILGSNSGLKILVQLN